MNPAIYSNAVRLNTTAWSQVQTSEIENVSYMILEENKKKILLFFINDKRKITMDSLSMDAFRLSKETRDTKFQNRLNEIFKDKSFAKWS